MNDIKIKFEIIQGDETFTVGDYVKCKYVDRYIDGERIEEWEGIIDNRSSSEYLVLENNNNEAKIPYLKIPYCEIAEIKSII